MIAAAKFWMVLLPPAAGCGRRNASQGRNGSWLSKVGTETRRSASVFGEIAQRAKGFRSSPSDFDDTAQIGGERDGRSGVASARRRTERFM